VNAAALTALLLGLAPGQSPSDNLGFQTGTLAGWKGYGFYLTSADHRGPSTSLGVCSSDYGRRGRTGELRYTFTVPPGAGLLRCRAYAACRKGMTFEDRLDVVVFTEDSTLMPKRVRGESGWQSAQGLLPRQGGQPREYSWDLSQVSGRRVQIVLVDQDDRSGCHLFCSGFWLTAVDEDQDQTFRAQMKKLERENRLPPMARFSTRHFIAWSNADADFTKSRLRSCELVYRHFFEHFRRRGFAVRPPVSKLMVAVFDSQSGFEAFLGQRMPSGITGVYTRDGNQLVIYELSQNQAVVARREKALQEARGLARDQDKLRHLETIHRHLSEWSQDAGLSTAMHETSHHLSFNCGLLNRFGDVPVWLAEGLATYCEATDEGGWQGIGEPNPSRIFVLDLVQKNNGKFIPLRVLIEDDRWRATTGAALLGYSQSWALFRMLMQERPAQFRAYLKMIYPRQGPEYRLADFCEVFGTDLERLEQRYHSYMLDLVRKYPPPPRR
jgi:hypothetical protein